LNRDNIAPADYSQFKNFFNAIVEAESKYVVFKWTPETLTSGDIYGKRRIIDFATMLPTLLIKDPLSWAFQLIGYTGSFYFN
jgi:hypothetical protein